MIEPKNERMDWKRVPGYRPYRPMTDWQPIETAPRATGDEWEGPEILCAIAETGAIYIGHHHAFDGGDDFVGNEMQICGATHWMPLPEPPR